MNGFISSLIQGLPYYILGLPAILISLSFHEMSHAFVANKLGDPTAKNVGRITMNPMKHIDPLGFLCMVILHFGWARPVPVNSRNFKNPKRDMALTALAGPLSNLILAVVFTVLLRLFLLLETNLFGEEIREMTYGIYFGQAYEASSVVTAGSLITYILYLGISINVSLAIFNLIPINPLDGSRILHIVLPTKWYFGIMKYERYITLGLMVLLFLGFLDGPLARANTFLVDNVFMKLSAMPITELYTLLNHVTLGFR